MGEDSPTEVTVDLTQTTAGEPCLLCLKPVGGTRLVLTHYEDDIPIVSLGLCRTCGGSIGLTIVSASPVYGEALNLLLSGRGNAE